MSKKRKRKSSEHGSGIPRGAVAADQSRQVVPGNSYYPPVKPYYVDIEFTCCDCGRREVWKARQQKWYYEVAKGSLCATAVRCRDCRNKIKDQKVLQRQQMKAPEDGADDG